MRLVGENDCKKCAHLESRYCNSCYHNDKFDNRYEEASFEEVERRRKNEHQEMENMLCDQFIRLHLTQEFTEIFSKAKYVVKDCPHPVYLTIFAKDNSILASDGYMMCQLFCDVPKPLRGKKLVKLVNSGICSGICISKYSQSLWDKYMERVQSLLQNKPDQQRLYNASEVKIEDENENAIFSFKDLDGSSLPLMMRTKDLENTVNMLGLEELTVGITFCSCLYFVFENATGKIVVSPIYKQD